MHPEQIKIFKNMTPARKLEIAAMHYHSARNLKEQSLRSLHPEWSDEEVKNKVRELFLYAGG